MRKKKNKDSQLEIYKNQMLDIYMNIKKLSLKIFVDDVQYPNHKSSPNGPQILGKDVIRLGINNLNETFDDIIKDSNYFLRFHDLSLITFNYKFDDSGNCIYINASYIETENEFGNRYLRFDYDNEGQDYIFHTLSHFHLSIHKNEIRIPYDGIISPCDFLSIVLLYFHKEEYDIVKKNFIKKSPNVETLERDERKLLRLNFGDNYE